MMASSPFFLTVVADTTKINNLHGVVARSRVARSTSTAHLRSSRGDPRQQQQQQQQQRRLSLRHTLMAPSTSTARTSRSRALFATTPGGGRGIRRLAFLATTVTVVATVHGGGHAGTSPVTTTMNPPGERKSYLPFLTGIEYEKPPEVWPCRFIFSRLYDHTSVQSSVINAECIDWYLLLWPHDEVVGRALVSLLVVDELCDLRC